MRTPRTTEYRRYMEKLAEAQEYVADIEIKPATDEQRKLFRDNLLRETKVVLDHDT